MWLVSKYNVENMYSYPLNKEVLRPVKKCQNSTQTVNDVKDGLAKKRAV